MALLGSNLANEVGTVGIRLILGPLASTNVVLRTACCSVGVVLPVYSTFKAIERRDENQRQKCLIYWAAYGSFTLVEVFADKLISWFPMYYHMKFAFLVWLQLPSTDGAGQLYRKHMRPFLLRHQAKVDRILGSAYGETVRLISTHQAEIQNVRTIFLKITGSVDQKSIDALEQLEVRNAIEDQPNIVSDSESRHEDLCNYLLDKNVT